ncbi:YybH family protein [Barrientosiimonas humi]|uniref:YybH family protein n=1 Tax=Barrientosiimonas humi TaxID=999931 RepID=UPI00370D4DA7
MSTLGYVQVKAVAQQSSEGQQAAVADGRAVATTPRQLLTLLGERIAAKDVDGIVALQEPNAAIIDWDLSVIRGRAAIRAFYVEWFKSNPVLTVTPQQIFVSGGQRQPDGSLLNRTGSIMGTYSLTQDKVGGGRETFTGNFCDIVRQQPSGTWLYLQDNPYPPHGNNDAPQARRGPATTASKQSSTSHH